MVMWDGKAPLNIRRKVEMLRYWNMLIHINVERLTKKTFLWDVYKLLEQIGKLESYTNQKNVDINHARQTLLDLDEICQKYYEKFKEIIPSFEDVTHVKKLSAKFVNNYYCLRQDKLYV